MKALILLENNQVCQVENDNNTFPVAEGLEWITCPANCDTTWTYDGTDFAPCVEPPQVQIDKLALIRAERDRRLLASDYTQLADVVALHDSTWLSAWNVYRQALRDLTDNIIDLDNPVYPIPPL